MTKNSSPKWDKNLITTSKADKFTDWMYSEIKPYLKGAILEIGSGFGTYSKKVADDFKSNKKVFSDVSPQYLDKLKEDFRSGSNIMVTHLDLNKKNNANINENSFDSIFSLNVLEHIENDIAALNYIYDLLKPKGTLIILVPAHKFLFNCIDKYTGHYRRYSKKELLEKISKTQFTIKKTFYFNFLSILGWYVHGNLCKKNIINEHAFGFFNRLVPVLQFIEKYILFKKIGISLIAVLEKD